MKTAATLFILPLCILSSVWANDAVKPKYGPMATRLTNSTEYVRKNPAPDYWALAPYYIAQQWGGSCSTASVAMITNAARVHLKLTADDALATQSKLLERIKDPVVGGKTWAVAVGAEGITPSGTTLDQLGVLTRKTLESYGLTVKRLDVVHADPKNSKVRERLHRDLLANEKSDSNFIIANFDQQKYTGDAQAGHIAPVAAYDPKKKRVLVMDPDRDYYEPYWVSEETFFEGMATQDSSGDAFRGYVYVELAR